MLSFWQVGQILAAWVTAVTQASFNKAVARRNILALSFQAMNRDNDSSLSQVAHVMANGIRLVAGWDVGNGLRR